MTHIRGSNLNCFYVFLHILQHHCGSLWERNAWMVQLKGCDDLIKILSYFSQASHVEQCYWHVNIEYVSGSADLVAPCQELLATEDEECFIHVCVGEWCNVTASPTSLVLNWLPPFCLWLLLFCTEKASGSSRVVRSGWFKARLRKFWERKITQSSSYKQMGESKLH